MDKELSMLKSRLPNVSTNDKHLPSGIARSTGTDNATRPNASVERLNSNGNSRDVPSYIDIRESDTKVSYEGLRERPSQGDNNHYHNLNEHTIYSEIGHADNTLSDTERVHIEMNARNDSEIV